MSEPLNFLKKKTPEDPDQDQILQGQCFKLVVLPEDLPRGHPEHPDNINTDFYVFHLELDDDSEVEAKNAEKAKKRPCEWCDAPAPSPYFLFNSVIINGYHYLIRKTPKEIERVKELERQEKLKEDLERVKRLDEELERQQEDLERDSQK